MSIQVIAHEKTGEFVCLLTDKHDHVFPLPLAWVFEVEGGEEETIIRVRANKEFEEFCRLNDSTFNFRVKNPVSDFYEVNRDYPCDMIYTENGAEKAWPIDAKKDKEDRLKSLASSFLDETNCHLVCIDFIRNGESYRTPIRLFDYIDLISGYIDLYTEEGAMAIMDESMKRFE